ncbi:TVP38/TMEM64 family protein [Alicyclobacillus sp. ALC3]|uniref:TVP38/TMEM64 family protein n=1 Tax=Alicyclobacillus sp. ALC3 TaxID=2796143 RepID=UPI0023781BB5|nr:VTT domain-containing protein [Alicyclobacillus sp. ALC3]WDL96357.1 TVP38/TMEM64 family protein [Alicyclobacillus sp. ALC3]
MSTFKSATPGDRSRSSESSAEEQVVHDQGGATLAQSGVRRKLRSILWGAAVILVGALLVAAFFYFDRNDRLSRLILATGAWGIVISIVAMTLFCIIPVPSEFLLVLNMKVYGVWWGSLFSWTGSMLGCIAVFLISRYWAGGLLRPFITNEQMSKVEKWVGHHGVTGLILARIVPLPFIVVNYTAGVVRSVTLWNFTWTSAVGGIPYYLGAACVFLGFSRRYMVWLIVGAVAVIGVWAVGYLYNRHASRLLWWSH